MYFIYFVVVVFFYSPVYDEKNWTTWVCGRVVAADPGCADVLMNELTVGAGGFINGPGPKIPAAGRPYMDMPRVALNAIFMAPIRTIYLRHDIDTCGSPPRPLARRRRRRSDEKQ